MKTKTVNRVCFAICCLLVSFDAKAAVSTVDFNQEAGMQLARGYDTLSGAIKGNCINRTEPTPPTGKGDSTASRVTFVLTKVENYSSLAHTVGVSASASLGSISGAASFVNNVNVNDYSIYVLAHVKVVNSTLSMPDPTLTQQASEVMNVQGADAFRNLCGDAFVVGYTTGGELYSIIEIQTKSSQEQRDISAKIGGNYGVFTGAGEFKDALAKISSSNNVNVYLYKVGGAGGPVQISPDEMIKSATAFPDTVRGDAAYVYQAALFPYENVPLPPGKTVVDVENQRDVLDKMSEYRLSNLQSLANIDYVLYHQGQFIDPNISELNSAADKTRANLNLISSAARKCYRNFSGCAFPTDIQVIAVQLPKRIEVAQDSSAEEELKREEQLKADALDQLRLAKKRTEDSLAELKAAQEDAQKQKQAADAAQAEANRLKAEAEKQEEEARRKQEEARKQQEEAQRQQQAAAAALAEATKKLSKTAISPTVSGLSVLGRAFGIK